MVKVKTFLRDDIEGRALAIMLSMFVWEVGIISAFITKEIRKPILLPIYILVVVSAISVCGFWGERLKTRFVSFTNTIYPMVSKVAQQTTRKWKFPIFVFFTIRTTTYSLPEVAARTAETIDGIEILGYIYIYIVVALIWMAIFNVMLRFLFPLPETQPPEEELAKLKHILEHLDGLLGLKGLKMTIDETRAVKLVEKESPEPNSLYPLYYVEPDIVIRYDNHGNKTILHQKAGYKDIYIKV